MTQRASRILDIIPHQSRYLGSAQPTADHHGQDGPVAQPLERTHVWCVN